MIHDDGQDHKYEEDYPEFLTWLLELLTQQSTCIQLENELQPPCIQEITSNEWKVPVVTEKDIPRDWVDWSAKISMENSKILNWWFNLTCLLYPLNTNADDNGKFNTISKMSLNGSLRFLRGKINLLKEGIHRKENHYLLTNIRQRCHINLENILHLFNSQELSILILANILRRPILLFSEYTLTKPLGGIYLPTTNSQESYVRDPLIIAQNSGYFMPLVRVVNQSKSIELSLSCRNAIPLTFSNFQLLPMKILPPITGLIDENSLLNYIDIVKINHETCHDTILMASMEVHDTVNFLENCIENSSEMNQLNNDSKSNFESVNVKPKVLNIPIGEDLYPEEKLVNILTESAPIRSKPEKYVLSDNSKCDNLSMPTFKSKHFPFGKSETLANVELVQCLADGCKNKITNKLAFPLCNECDEFRRLKVGIVKIRLAQNAHFTHILKNKASYAKLKPEIYS